MLDRLVNDIQFQFLTYLIFRAAHPNAKFV
jgi:hypothetical protein